jgi:hypothetical protein
VGEQALDTFQIGDVILDKYDVTDVLGEGGMGVILAARHRKLGELRALKFLRRALLDKPDVAARFEQEARTASCIQSAHVARVHDVEAVDGVPFIVMEHLTGQDLAAVLRERIQLPIAEAADLLLQPRTPHGMLGRPSHLGFDTDANWTKSRPKWSSMRLTSASANARAGCATNVSLSIFNANR